MTRALLSVVLAAGALYPATLTNIHDGDTFTAWIEVRPGLRELETVRLDCGNAAELRADGGTEARTALVNALDGGPVFVRSAWKREKYGRLLGDGEVNGRSACAVLRDAGVLQ